MNKYAHVMFAGTLALAIISAVVSPCADDDGSDTKARETAVASSMLRGNAAHTGYYPSALGKRVRGMKNLKKVFVGAAGDLYAFDADTGKELWKAHDIAVASSPVVVNGGVVFIGSEEHLYTFDAKTGKELWKVQINGVPFSDPVVADFAE